MKPIRLITLTILVVALLSGCAALEVQVDVYKGPLTNDPDIQIKQAASMVMAAKPLLEQLRHSAECDYIGQHKGNPALASGLRAKLNERYEAICGKGHNDRYPDFHSDSYRFYTWQGRHAHSLLKEYNQDNESSSLGTMFDEYLNMDNEDSAAGKPPKPLRNRMIHFAEKLRVMGNADILFTANASNLSPWITTDSEAMPAYQASEDISKYASVLQTIGNGMITLLDDWEKSREHKKALKGDWLDIQKQARLEARKLVLETGLKRIQENIKATKFTDDNTLLTELEKGLTGLTMAADAAKKLRGARKAALDKASALEDTIKAEAMWRSKKDKTEQVNIEAIKNLIPKDQQSAFDSLSKSDCPGDKQTIADWRNCLSTAASKDTATKRAVFNQADLWHAQLRHLLQADTLDTLAVGMPSPRNAKDIYDVVSNSLKHAHVNAVANHGADDPLAKTLAQALEVNERYRRDLIRIRPAFSYLRNSLPATNLQEDGGEKYPNLLTRAIKRASPIDNDDTLRMRSDLDKQYWHTVNRIQVSGVGDTMQVLVKDDIGNWYVKGLSSKPEDLVKSLRGITSYAIGRNLKTPIELGKEAGQETKDTVISSEFKKYQEHFRDRYIAAILGEAKKLKNADGSAITGCQLNIDADPITLAKDPKQGVALKDYHEDVLCRLKKAEESSPTKAIADSIQNARNAYEQELKFMSDLTGFKIE